jgi:7-cyano-7-deazaguanine reductase
MFSQVSPEFIDKVKKLHLVYTDEPQPKLLIVVPNPHADLKYTEELEFPEFTSLCPLAAGQPDFATIKISYVPKSLVIELKSLKLYLTSYRDVQIFHEAVVGQILKDLSLACEPDRMKVVGVFTVRGGIQTTITAEER